VTFDYEKGDYSWRKLSVSFQKNGKLKGEVSKAEKGKPDNLAQITWRFMTITQVER
jgi:hypothetical protein